MFGLREIHDEEALISVTLALVIGVLVAIYLAERAGLIP